MMTKEEKLLIVALRLDGYTLREIAETFTQKTGKRISFQYVAHTLNSLSTGESKNVCKYPAIWDWMKRNDMDTEALAILLGITNAKLKKILRIALPMTDEMAEKIATVIELPTEEVKKTYAIYEKRKPVQDRYISIKYPAILHYLETHRYPISKIAKDCGIPYYKAYSAVTSLSTRTTYEQARTLIAQTLNIDKATLFAVDD